MSAATYNVRGTRFALTTNAILVYLFLYAPIILLVVFSFSDDQIVGQWGGFTFDWYREFAGNQPLQNALWISVKVALWSTVISVSASYAVADCGLKSLGMDHGNPALEGAKVWFCSDEHITFAPEDPLSVGDRVRVAPAHVDPTLAYHERMHLVSGDEVLETWEIDLRGW